MWSGGRSLRRLVVAGGVIGSLGTGFGQAPLCDGLHPGNPELISGAASCVYNEVGGVSQTVIDLGATSIIRWNHLGLQDPASTLTFNWTGNPSGPAAVINRVEGATPLTRNLHDLSGTVRFPDGTLVITNPNSTPQIRGSVVAGSVVFTTHRLDPAMEEALLAGEAADFTGARKPLEINDGRIVATRGDVVLGGRAVQNTADRFSAEDSPEIVALQGSVRIFGGENFRLLPSGRERLVPLPGAAEGSIRSSKGIRAAQDVELSARAAIDNFARISANDGGNRIYLRVSDDAGQINNEATGFIDGFVFASHPITNSGTIVDDDTDAVPSLSTGISHIRVPPRPGGKSRESKTEIVFENAPTAGSASAQRDRAASGSATANRRSGGRVASNTRGSLARGRSFFGMRGGSAASDGKKKSR